MLTQTWCRLATMRWITHWGRVTHICVSKLTIIGTYNGLLPSRHQAIIWTNAAIMLIGHLWTNFSAILIRIETFSFKKMHLKISSILSWPECIKCTIFHVAYMPCAYLFAILSEFPHLLSLFRPLHSHLLGQQLLPNLKSENNQIHVHVLR